MRRTRQFLFKTTWKLAWPLRTYIRRTSSDRGRALSEAILVRTLLRLAPASFEASLPGGGAILLLYREQIGLSTLLNGPFEASETEALCRLARPGTTAVDAGANVGVFTVPLAKSVGAAGHVLAFEPSSETAGRLAENLRRNGLENVKTVQAALGRTSGQAALSVRDDSAYASVDFGSTATGVVVPVERLDDVWEREGNPEVSVLKVDVEGSELDVLSGASQVLRNSRPAVLVEAVGDAQERAVGELLAEHGYVRSTPSGFQPWNHLFLPAPPRGSVSGAALDAATSTRSVPRRNLAGFALPPLLLAMSLSGLWVYLGTLDLAGVAPRSVLTGGYYFVLGSGLAAAAWAGRDTIRRRLSTQSRVPLVWLVAAGALALWFLANVALLSSGTVARDAAALLVLSSAPSALAVLSLSRAQLRVAAGAVVGLALGLAAVGLAVLLTGSEPSARFSPIDELDPITTAHVTAMGAVVLLAWRFATQRAQLAQGVGVAVLTGLTILPASRGALLALFAGLVAVGLVLRKRFFPILLPAVIIGLTAGAIASTVTGADYYLGIDVPGFEIEPPEHVVDFTGEEAPTGLVAGQEPISSLAIRRYLMRKALEDVPDRPLFGHGVGMLLNDSPDALRMVRSGSVKQLTRTHPHNVLVESLYSLGVLGFTLFVALVGTSAVALLRVLKSGRERLLALVALALAALTAVNASVSGEIGSDAYLWVALALPVALYADEASVTPSK